MFIFPYNVRLNTRLHKQNSIDQEFFVYFGLQMRLEKAPGINKNRLKQLFLFILMWVWADNETREGARDPKMSEKEAAPLNVSSAADFHAREGAADILLFVPDSQNDPGVIFQDDISDASVHIGRQRSLN